MTPHSVNTAVCATRLFCNNIRNTLAMTSAKKKRILLRRMQCMFMYGVIAANATISGGFAQRLVNACKYGPNAFRMFTGTAQNIALAAATIKFSSSCNTTRSHLQTKNRAHTAATLKYSSPGVPPIARPNRESCSRCGHTQILILGGTPGALGWVLQFWVAEHKFWEFLFAKLERGSWRFSRAGDVIISYFAFCMEILIILIPGRPQRRCRVRDARHGGLFASG